MLKKKKDGECEDKEDPPLLRAIDLTIDPETFADFLREMALRGSCWVRVAVAKNERTAPNLLRDLAGDDHVGVQLAVALNPLTLGDAFKLLYGDVDGGLREHTRLRLENLRGAGLDKDIDD